jgi:hypothetical protein
LRRYTPAFLEAFEFRAVPAARKILEAVEVLKRLSASKARSVPEDAPTEFVRRRWASHVFTEAGLDRRYYELCTLTELRNALRSGDIWVPGSPITSVAELMADLFDLRHRCGWGK